MINFIIMKYKALVIIYGFYFLLLLCSCVSGFTFENNINRDSCLLSTAHYDLTEYSGVYKTNAHNQCQLSIIIAKAGDDYNYTLLLDNQEYTGKFMLENKNGQIYFILDGKIGNNVPREINGQFIDGNIIIQNYVNSKNEHCYFEICDEKYIKFIKL